MSPKLVEHGPTNARNRISAEGESPRGLIARRRLHQAQGTGANELVEVNLVMQPPSELPRDVMDKANVLLRKNRNVLGRCVGRIACDLGGGRHRGDPRSGEGGRGPLEPSATIKASRAPPLAR